MRTLLLVISLVALFATPALPGWWADEKPVDADTRIRDGADEGELGLGPMDPEMGRFSGIRLTESGIRIEYEIKGTPVVEVIRSFD